MEERTEDQIDHSSRAHARLGASSSMQWLSCPGSIQLQERFYATNPEAEDIDREAADEGEFAHEVSDWCIKNRIHPLRAECAAHFKSINTGGYNLTEVLANVASYFDYVGFVMGEVDSYETFWEVRVDFSRWVEDGFGTLDLGFVSENSVFIFDLKYGKWKVDVRENSQLMLYSLGLYASLTEKQQRDITGFLLNICQPRISYFGKYNISKDDLFEFGDYAKQQSILALGDNPPLARGDKQCKWCCAKPICPMWK